MQNTEILIKRLDFVSNNFPTYFLSSKKNPFRHKRTQTNQVSIRIKTMNSQDSPSFTSRTLRSSISPKNNPSWSLIHGIYSNKNYKPMLPLQPSTARLHLSRPSSNQVSKLSIPLRLKPRSPNTKYLKIKIPKVALNKLVLS